MSCIRMDRSAAGTSVPAVLLTVLCLGSLWAADVSMAGEYDNLPWTPGEGIVTLGDQSMNEAKEQALRLARNQAIETVTGVLVRSVTERVQQEAGNVYVDQFREITSLETAGHIVEQTEPLYRVDPAADGLFQVICEIRARVAVEDEEPNTSFVVDVDLKDRADKTYRSGDEMILEIQSTRDCFLTVFNVYSDGTSALLMPSGAAPDNHLRAGASLELPRAEDRRRGVAFPVYALEDREITVEHIFVVATLDEHPFIVGERTEADGDFIPVLEATPEQLTRWMLKIPRNRRARAETFYSVIP